MLVLLCIHTSPIGFSDPRESDQFVEQILPWVSRASSRRAVGGPSVTFPHIGDVSDVYEDYENREGRKDINV